MVNFTSEFISRQTAIGVPQNLIKSKTYLSAAMFIAALFTIARTWKKPKGPLTDEWIKKMWHIYTMEYYSAIKRNEIELFLIILHINHSSFVLFME